MDDRDTEKMSPGAVEMVLAAASALLDPEKLARLVVDHLKHLLRVDGVALYWWDAEEQALTALADNDPHVEVPVPVINPHQGIVGNAFARNAAMTTDADGAHPEDGPSWMRELNIKAGVAVPIRVEQLPRGVLVARSYSERTFTAEEIETIRVLGAQIAPTLATMGLLARAQRERSITHAYAELMRAASTCEGVDDLMRLIVHFATRLLGADHGGINVREPEKAEPQDEQLSLGPIEGGGELLSVPIATPKRYFGMLLLAWRVDVDVTPAQQSIAVTLAKFAAAALDRAHTDDAVRRHEALLRSVLKSAPVAFLVVDRHCRITFREGIDLVRLGLDATAVGDLLPQREGALAALRDTAIRALAGEEVVEAIASDQVALELRFVPVRDASGEITGASGVAIDLSERRGLEDKLAYRATHDALTELPNRDLFLDRLEQAVLASQRTRDPLAVVVLDVEDFADVNATLGPRGADTALQELAKRLVARTEFAGATLARVDGDRFGWILPGAGENAVLAFIRRIATVADAPFHVEGRVAGLRVTLGIAMLAGVLTEAAELTRHAIIAMQRARDEHATFAFFDSAMDRDPDALAVVTELRDAVTRDALTLRYQPIVSIGDGRTYAAEALVRWMHPERGMVGPESFVPVAERVGLIGRVTAWVLDNALRDLARWHADGLKAQLTVNLSAWDVADPTLPERFGMLAEKHRIDATDVTFEITESAIMSDRPMTLDVLRRLTASGASVALDDFGTGYSSFAYLQRLPISCIKIDRSFVRELPERVESRVIVGALIHLGKDLNLHVVAEGVEREEERAILEMLGCPSAQGHLFARALPYDDLIARLRTESPAHLGKTTTA